MGSRVLRRSAASAPCFILLAALALCAGCHGEPTPPDSSPNVLLISVDTLRADAIGAYGAPDGTTPFLDRLARGGVRFDRAYAQTSWTAPSVASLLTSLHPDTHGVTTGKAKLRGARQQRILAPQIETLAEALKRAGYRTFAVVTNGHLVGELGFGQGFDRFVHINELGWENHGDEITRRAIELESEIAGEDSPYFLWLHYFDPHIAYELRSTKTGEPRAEGEPSCDEITPITPSSTRKLESQPDWLPCARIAYASEVSAVDAAIQRVFEGLAISPADLVVLTSDHGEEFLEHGKTQHGRTLYEEVARVPLIIRLPENSNAGASVGEPVSLVDIMPSILELAGVTPPERAQGTSFVDAIGANGSTSRPPVILSLSRRPRETMAAIIDGTWKLIVSADGTRKELYDLENDPNETQNIVAREPDLVASLAARLAAALEQQRRQAFEMEDGRAFSNEEIEQLKAMGYVE